jgi:site-specific DNA recombinase
MKQRRAVIYTRVSTDDQADRGYSLPYQEERLRKYCESNNLVVVAHYQDDHSAKTFVRPEFQKFLNFAKKQPGEVDLLLFTNWSRFSRNATDSYAMLSTLRKLAVEPQAIEQPLDLSIPENKIMLAFYLAAPEVENDRRSANVITGVYRARKEGRWANVAPAGYKNVRGDDGKATIVPDAFAPLVREAFEQFATGAFGVEELRRKMYKKGLKSERSSFHVLLRNHAYIGRVCVPAFKGEPAYYTRAVHEPLVTEELYYQVQNILQERKPNRPTKNTTKEEVILLGHLTCRRCGSLLTGSASHGNGGRYFYYHCQHGCKERFRAENAHEEFRKYLSSFKPNRAAIESFYEYLTSMFQSNQRDDKREVDAIDAEIARNQKRLQNAKQMRLDGEFDIAGYKEMKVALEETINDLIRKKATLSAPLEDYEKYIRHAVTIVRDLGTFYEGLKDLASRDLLVGSIFPEKLIFENQKYRTTRINEAVRLICLIHKELENKKADEKNLISSSSASADRTGLEPATSAVTGRHSNQLNYRSV